MSYSVKILADSLGPTNKRIVTWELSYPRFIHSEFMTHRMFSRNAASSRAIPLAKMINNVINDAVLPKWWGKNQAGMQAREELSEDTRILAEQVWIDARNSAIYKVRKLEKLGLHKQIANRLLEPWMFITVIATATEHNNFFHLRCHPDAQPEFQWLAIEMKKLYETHVPNQLKTGEWHLPLVSLEDLEQIISLNRTEASELACKVSVGRCARVSYLTHDGKRDIHEDIKLHDKLVTSGHWSPFEHVALATNEYEQGLPKRYANFFGWKPYRKCFAQENFGDLPNLS